MLIAAIFFSCKKDKSAANNTSGSASTEGGIIYRQLNRSIAWEQYNLFNHIDIDLDEDSTNELSFYIVSESGSILDVSYDNIYVQTYCPESSDKIYFANYEGGTDPNLYNLATAVPIGSLINDETGDNFELDNTNLAVKKNDQNGAVQFTLGDFYGAGDTFLGFKIKIEDNYHFGWLRVNLAPDLKTLLIIDGAYQSEADLPINAGTH